MTEKGMRGRPMTARTLRDMALDDTANAADDIGAAIKLLAHAARRLGEAHTSSKRGYHRIVGAQEYEDRDRTWDGRERRGRERRRLEVAA
jgi:hypothetical protein